MNGKKIAIVYDWIDKWGGVERVLLTLFELFPRADFFTSYVDHKTAPWAKGLYFKTSFIQNLPSFVKKNRVFSTPLYPYAFESFDFSKYDVVLSISSSFAKGIVTTAQTKHVSYILTPSRFLWSHSETYLTNSLFKKMRPAFQRWDFAAAQRPDRILALSKTVQSRIKKYYKRDSDVLYPPFDIDYWKKISPKIEKSLPKKFFLLVSRLEPYKRVDIALDAFKDFKEALVIVGAGSLKNKLKNQSGKNVIFLSDLSDKEIAGLYLKAEALIFPQEEDFGYVLLEAVFFGLPIIAYKKGGATETVIDGQTGIFFDDQNSGSLKKAVERFKKVSYNLKNSANTEGRTSIEKFRLKNFREQLLRELF